MLVTDGGQIIRTPVIDVRIAGRNTQGVTLFDTAEDESVVSVSRLEESTIDESEDGMPDDEGDDDDDEVLDPVDDADSETSDSEPNLSEPAGDMNEPTDDTEEQD